MEMSTSLWSDRRRSTQAVLLGLLMGAFSGLGQVVSTALSGIGDDLALSSVELSFLAAAILIGVVPAVVFVTPWLRRFDQRVVLVCLCAATTLLLATAPLSSSFQIIFGVLVMIGLAGGTEPIIRALLQARAPLADEHGEAQRNKVLSATFAFGTGVFVGVFPLIANALEWQWSFWISAGLFAAIAVPACWLVPGTTSAPVEAAARGRSFWKALRDPAVARTGLYGALNGLAYGIPIGSAALILKASGFGGWVPALAVRFLVTFVVMFFIISGRAISHPSAPILAALAVVAVFALSGSAPLWAAGALLLVLIIVAYSLLEVVCAWVWTNTVHRAPELVTDKAAVIALRVAGITAGVWIGAFVTKELGGAAMLSVGTLAALATLVPARAMRRATEYQEVASGTSPRRIELLYDGAPTVRIDDGTPIGFGDAILTVRHPTEGTALQIRSMPLVGWRSIVRRLLPRQHRRHDGDHVKAWRGMLASAPGHQAAIRVTGAIAHTLLDTTITIDKWEGVAGATPDLSWQIAQRSPAESLASSVARAVTNLADRLVPLWERRAAHRDADTSRSWALIRNDLAIMILAAVAVIVLAPIGAPLAAVALMHLARAGLGIASVMGRTLAHRGKCAALGTQLEVSELWALAATAVIGACGLAYAVVDGGFQPFTDSVAVLGGALVLLSTARGLRAAWRRTGETQALHDDLWREIALDPTVRRVELYIEGARVRAAIKAVGASEEYLADTQRRLQAAFPAVVISVTDAESPRIG